LLVNEIKKQENLRLKLDARAKECKRKRDLYEYQQYVKKQNEEGKDDMSKNFNKSRNPIKHYLLPPNMVSRDLKLKPAAAVVSVSEKNAFSLLESAYLV